MAAAPQKKMSLVQLTFMVAVNMMGSGIIMLPTNLAQIGAISSVTRYRGTDHRRQRTAAARDQPGHQEHRATLPQKKARP